MPHPPTPQQRAVYKWVRTGSGNLILIAVAGAGKTTTILNCAAIINDWCNICAYNRKIADEINTKLKGSNISPKVKAGTFHSFGLWNWRRQNPKVEIDGYKIKGILGQQKVNDKLHNFVTELVSLAKNHAVGVDGPVTDAAIWEHIVEHYDVAESLPDGIDEATSAMMVEDGIGFAMRALMRSQEIDEQVIDFDDMLYAPLVHPCRLWLSKWIFVDEAQDTNPARRILAKRMLAPEGRIVFVGDPAQAIYGFTGADNNSLDIIKEEFQCEELPLTVTHRCPKSVVNVARKYVKHITAADTAPEGSVSNMRDTEFLTLTPDHFTKEAVMLCRTTAPLVTTAYALLRRGIPCHVEGKKIGQGLLHLINRFPVNGLDALDAALGSYLQTESEKLLAAGKEKKVEVLVDKIETIRVIMESLPVGSTIAGLKDQIVKLFGDTPEDRAPETFTLSTVHKAKGREWKTVYLLDRNKLMPSKYAKQEWQLEQEYNLIYVAVTRSMDKLIEVTT